MHEIAPDRDVSGLGLCPDKCQHYRSPGPKSKNLLLRVTENDTHRAYPEKLTVAYERYFHAYDAGSLLIVNASSIDPVHNLANYEVLYQ